jgi:hypothetical protein
MIKKIVWQHKNEKNTKDVLFLSLKDINHLKRIYKEYNIHPESIDEVRIEYLADKNPLIRYIIKELDIMLCVGGRFILNSTSTTVHGNYIRSISQIGYEFAVSTNGRYFMDNKTIDDIKFSSQYIKKHKTLHKDDSIDNWSFGIITNGKKNEQVRNLISSIIAQNILNYEIIICGSFEYCDKEKFPIISIEDVILNDDIRAPITIKKNKIAHAAKFQNLVILHDRYLLPNDWYHNMKIYGNYFDLLTMPNIGQNSGRVNDWGQHLGKPSQIYREVNHLLPYKKWSEGWYTQGGLLIIKKNFYFQNRLDNRLFWGELEDVQFSQIGNLLGWFYYLDVNNKIFTFSDRLGETNLIAPNKMLTYLKTCLKSLYYYYKSKIKNMCNYYLNIRS